MEALELVHDAPVAPADPIPAPPVAARFKLFLERIQRLSPPAFDLLLAFAGLLLVAFGVALVYVPAAFIVAGLALFYLGVWHR